LYDYVAFLYACMCPKENLIPNSCCQLYYPFHHTQSPNLPTVLISQCVSTSYQNTDIAPCVHTLKFYAACRNCRDGSAPKLNAQWGYCATARLAGLLRRGRATAYVNNRTPRSSVGNASEEAKRTSRIEGRGAKRVWDEGPGERDRTERRYGGAELGSHSAALFAGRWGLFPSYSLS
jgi:hypothetical protein